MTAKDVPEAAAILADIVAIGGTTAIEVVPEPDQFAQWYLGDDPIACHVAVDETGTVVGAA